MTKKNSELKKGDKIRTEFGDYDNKVTVTVESIKPCEDGVWVLIVGHYSDSGKHVEMYGYASDFVEVIEGRKENDS